jgi:hypothetical protein
MRLDGRDESVTRAAAPVTRQMPIIAIGDDAPPLLVSMKVRSPLRLFGPGERALQAPALVSREAGRICTGRRPFSRCLTSDQRRRIMDYLGVVILGCFAFAGLMGWLGNRR